MVGWPSRCDSRATPQPADAIVVFAGGVGESGQAGGGYQERVKQAVDLYHAGYAPRMIFSSGFVFAFQEGEIMRGLAMANGVPSDAILLETQAANTYENVTRSTADPRQPRLAQRPAGQLAVPHAARDADVAEERAGDRGDPDAGALEPVLLRHGGPSLEQIRGLLQEYAAIALYWWRGWI